MNTLATWLPLLLLPAVLGAADVPISIDAASPAQIIEGFGMTWGMEYFSGSTPVDVLTPSQRARVLDAQFNQVKIRLGQSLPLYEAPQSTGSDFFGARANDNADPFTLDWAGFNTWTATNFKAKISDAAPAGTASGIYPAINLNSSSASPWLNPYTSARKQAILDECAEKSLAMVSWWTTAYGAEPRFAHLVNEGFSGNTELQTMPPTWAADLVRTCGKRLRDAGYKTVKFVYPNEETESASLNIATQVLADPEARSYMGAIGFHPYPYGSDYSKVASILAGPGTGNPVASRVTVRNQLRDLAAPYGIQVWMTEASQGYYGQTVDYSTATGFNGLRARAIHIHDEFVYANASAWFGMNSSWSRTSTQLHNPSLIFYGEAEAPVLTDQNSDEVFITYTGYAIGHYARWIAPRSRRLACTSGDALIQTTAFRDRATGRLVLVAINNDASARTVAVSLAGAAIGGTGAGERSTSAAYWQPLSSWTVPAGSTSMNLTLPALSVTSIAVPFSSSPANRAPTVYAGEDQTVPAGSPAVLHGVSTDDGLPSDTLTTAWSKVSGPGVVAFSSASYLDSAASFSVGGTYVIRLTASDGALSTTDDLVVTVQPGANTPPTIGGMSSQVTAEDTPTSAIPFTIGDAETAAGSLSLSASSANSSLAPSGGIVFSGSGTNRSVTITPGANQNGSTLITITVTDGSGATASSSFALTVNAVNDAPVMDAIADQSLPIDGSSAAIAFTISDAESTATALVVSASSSDTALVPLANIVFGGSGANRSVTVTPATGQSGSAIITVTVSDGSATTSRSFLVFVNSSSSSSSAAPPTAGTGRCGFGAGLAVACTLAFTARTRRRQLAGQLETST